MSRERILNRLNTALPIARLKQSAPIKEDTPEPLSEHERVRRFLAAWTSLGGTYDEFVNEISARLAILLYLQEHDINELLSWDADQLAVSGLGEAFADARIEITTPDRRSLNPNILLGLTSADAALADTGSLILAPSAGHSWLPALLPIRHFVILPVSRIYSDLASWREQWQEDGRLHDLALSAIVTGPSCSDDIELHPHYGMFGPRLTHLFLVWGL